MAQQDTPPWPSLYNPGIEILHVDHNDPRQPGGAYLYNARDIFRFTFYWTLVFYTPIFLVCGTYAFWNYAFPPAPRSPGSRHTRDLSYQLVPVGTPSRAKFGAQPTQTPKLNERRSRVAFALIVLFTFLMMSLAGSVISSAILGFVAAGLYKSANFNMSTWIPFLLAMLQAAIGLLSVWPSIIEII